MVSCKPSSGLTSRLFNNSEMSNYFPQLNLLGIDQQRFYPLHTITQNLGVFSSLVFFTKHMFSLRITTEELLQPKVNTLVFSSRKPGGNVNCLLAFYF